MSTKTICLTAGGVRVGELSFSTGGLFTGSRLAVDGAEAIRDLMEFARHIPNEVASVYLSLPVAARTNHLNAGVTMDLYSQLKQNEDVVADRPIQLVSPRPNSYPDDGLLKFVAVESISELVNGPGPAVVLTFDRDNEELLNMVVEYGRHFGFDPVVISDLPGCEYFMEFERATYPLKRVSYHSVVADILEESRRINSLSEQERESSIIKKEEDRFVRKSGDVKELTKFTTADPAEETE